jgi:hypothetical protein
MVSLGYRTETLKPINMRSTKYNGATEPRTSWTRRSLSRNLLEHVDVVLTFCGHQVHQDRSHQASGIHTAGQGTQNSQACSKPWKLRTSPDQADVCPEHAMQVFRKKTDGLSNGLA